MVGERRIRFGLSAVKNVGLGAIESIIAARSKKPYKTMRDFVTRVDLRLCNRKVLESLIKCGAFDSLGGHRAQYLAVLDDLLAQGQAEQRERDCGQLSMFSLLGEDEQKELLCDALVNIEPFSSEEQLTLEKEMLGLYITGHPLEPFREMIENNEQLTRCAELGDTSDNSHVTVGGIVVAVRKFYTKKNKQMAFVKIEDLTGSVELVIFPDLFERYSSLLEEDNLIVVEGRTDLKEEEDVKILIESIRRLNHKDRYYRLELGEETDEALLASLKDLLVAESGNVPVCIYFKKDKKTLMLEEDFWVRDHPACRERLEELLGRNAVREQRKNGESSIFTSN